ncbi:MAG: tRNA uridine-5-carboxymethylaminomethyl(34) synthesis GTPase MnmE [Hyphomicrobiaceae bacterium]|nr:tRNA uridine-5-carboxymethylaminomethyl(34) synthesis GTPase MnmE [Hyphomicrobiaceae bacterium]MCC0009428.1 tRNA uridine-5-carboxymethylaminomethyl(34) synthesis GTPase MnmE [Hyphomicrobiaceae bacterium]
MTANQRSTIFALSTAPGRAGVAVIRASGPHAGMAVNVMAPKRPRARAAEFRKIIHPTTGETLDQGLVIWFPAPGSFTGEDVVEFHLHGSVAVVRAVLAGLALIPGFRQAEPGEFARRAFDNGKIDLTQAEGLADLIDAETEAQRKQALRQSRGKLADLYESWRSSLIDAAALVEASLDFTDEADVAADAFAQGRTIIEDLARRLDRHLADGNRGEILRSGFQVVLAGPPNVGKSSLLNALARRDAAIVSAEAGTTRDVIEVRLDLGGLPVIVSDTAGIRETDAAVEQEGIRRSVVRASEADLVIWLTDIDAPEPLLPKELLQLAERTLLVVNKVDLAVVQGQLVLPDDMIAVSVKTGDGLDSLTDRLAAIVKDRIAPGDVPALTQHRHRTLLEDAADSLRAFLAGDANQVELRAEDLRRAAVSVGRITGRIDVEDVLDQVFGRFCIGK